MVAVTTTINTIFGAKMMVASLGLVLNDEMDDFAVAPGVPNAFKLVGAVTNEIAPGKRPLSSMSPIIVMQQRPSGADGRRLGRPDDHQRRGQVALNVLDFHLGPGGGGRRAANA